MLLQVMAYYSSVPNPRALRLHEIRFLYDGQRRFLHDMTKAKNAK